MKDYMKYVKGLQGVNQGARPDLLIFTLTMDRLDYTKRMVESLEANTKGQYTHIFIDQNSSDDTIDYLDRLPLTQHRKGIAVYSLDRNIGISKGSNIVLDVVSDMCDKPKYICKLDNDCEVLSEGWDETFKFVVENHPKIVLSPFVEGLRENRGGAPRYHHGFMFDDNETRIELGFTTHLGGIFEFSKLEAYDGFRYNEEDTLSGSQDSSFSAHVVGRGYLMAYVENLRCAHMDTTDGQHEKYPEYFKRRAEVESKVPFKET